MRIGAFKKGLAFEARPSANHKCEKRDNERLWGMFYRGPTVGAKCTYQNPELTHVRVYMAKVDS